MQSDRSTTEVYKRPYFKPWARRPAKTSNRGPLSCQVLHEANTRNTTLLQIAKTIFHLLNEANHLSQQRLTLFHLQNNLPWGESSSTNNYNTLFLYAPQPIQCPSPPCAYANHQLSSMQCQTIFYTFDYVYNNKFRDLWWSFSESVSLTTNSHHFTTIIHNLSLLLGFSGLFHQHLCFFQQSTPPKIASTLEGIFSSFSAPTTTSTNPSCQ